MNELAIKSLASYEGKQMLVTGGLGMIGSFVATTASSLGAKVTVIDNMLPDHGGNLANLKGFENDIEVINGDILDKELMDKLVLNKDLIVHCAAHVSYTDSMKNPYLDLEINGRGHLNILEACRYHNPGAKVVFTSSRMKYGSCETIPVTESQPAAPLLFYGAHKLLGEHYNEIYFKNFGVPYTNLVVPNPYGPRQQMKHHRYGLVNWFMRMAMEDKEITIFGDGSQVRDYIYVEDITRAILLCGITEESTGRTVNLGNGSGTAFKEMVETVVDVVGSGSYKHVDWPEDYFNIETGDYVADISMASNFGYEPEVSFRKGVEKTVEFYRERQSDYW